jgi:hypothetical protein
MADNVYTAAGSTLYVSATLPATEDEAGYDALTWIEVGEVSEIPEMGGDFSRITWTALSKRKVTTRKGSKSFTEMSLPYAYSPIGDDAGQEIISDFEGTDTSCAFRVDVQDPAIATFCFTAQVYKNAITVGTTESIVMRTAVIVPNDVPLEFAPF